MINAPIPVFSSGEAEKLKWIDIDFEHNTVRVAAEKNSDPRILNISNKLAGMLQVLPKTNEKLFGTVSSNTHSGCLEHTRKVLARKFNNPRLLEILPHATFIGRQPFYTTKQKMFYTSKNFSGIKESTAP